MLDFNHNLALTWVLKSSRWKPHWKRIRAKVGPDFKENFDDGWWFDGSQEQQREDADAHWRQRLWENVMICQGLEGLGMIRPELQESWLPKIGEWKAKIAKLEAEPALTVVGRQATLEYPYLLGDLRICASGHVAGT